MYYSFRFIFSCLSTLNPMFFKIWYYISSIIIQFSLYYLFFNTPQSNYRKIKNIWLFISFIEIEKKERIEMITNINIKMFYDDDSIFIIGIESNLSRSISHVARIVSSEYSFRSFPFSKTVTS